MINWKELKDKDILTISKCAKRAKEMIPEIDLMSCEMDLSAVHLKTPLKLKELLAGDNGNFGHDVFGIIGHIDRSTGELRDCFVPRYSC